MSRDFVETGQAFTGEGDPFCPIERKPRGAAGVATAIIVLLAGAGFLTYASVSTPTPIAHEATSEPVALERNVESELMELAQAIPATPATERPEQVNTAPSDDEIAAAIAAARQARAAIATHQETIRATDGRTPSLKPTLTNSTDNAQGFGPRLKPTAQPLAQTIAASNTPKTPTANTSKTTARVQIVHADEYILADNTDAPAPFFFASDLQRRVIDTTPVAVLYAGDLSSDITESRIKIRRGENFVETLKRAGVNTADRNEAARAFGKHYNLRKLLPGQEFTLTLARENQTLFEAASTGGNAPARLIGLEFRQDSENKINLRWEKENQFSAKKSTIAMTTRYRSIAGEIEGSLYLAAKAQGATDKVIADFANTFAYDVDFQREIFGGDEFEAIFEANYDDQGKLASSGDILFARLNWRGRKQQKDYFRFESADGIVDYYDVSGQSAKRLLMKTPIDGARLSSRFGTRKHPILGYRRAHKGVDFAAPRGTPIKAAGDGVIERANRYGSFGNYVLIRHANGYKTAYAHLKGFRRGIRKGKRVRQGEIIGYVGTTGRSTGPHLHYEVHLKGKAVNPQKLKIATGKKLKGDELAAFEQQRDSIEAMRKPVTVGLVSSGTASISANGAL